MNGTTGKLTRTTQTYEQQGDTIFHFLRPGVIFKFIFAFLELQLYIGRIVILNMKISSVLQFHINKSWAKMTVKENITKLYAGTLYTFCLKGGEGLCRPADSTTGWWRES